MFVGFAGYFRSQRLPELVRRENERIRAAYRAQVSDAKDETRGEVFDRAASGLRKIGSMGREPYGFSDDYATGWYVTDGVARRIPLVPEEWTDYTRLFVVVASVVSVLMIALTVFGVRCLWKFVRDREDFLAATAHDLTTPLAALRYLIGRNEDEERRLNERMIRLVENLKDFLALGGRRPPVARESVDLVACYREAYALFRDDYRDLFDGEDVPLAVGEEPILARGDETRIVQLFWNLLANDLKYAAPYGKVRVSFARANGFVRVVFADEGPGMTPREMRHAFDRYFRARTVLESGKGGFGIGLCTAREFARAMGGDLVVMPNGGQGCRFELTLEAARPEDM